MNTHTKVSILALFQEGVKMWEWFAENPHADKILYSCFWPKSPLLDAKNKCAGCEEVAGNCSECRLLTEEEKRDASDPDTEYSKFCCNGEYKTWLSLSTSWTDKKIAAARIAERHRKAIETLEEK